MSKQLAISSSFSIFAMACLMLVFTEDRSGFSGADTLVPVQVEMPELNLPKPALLP